MTRMMIAAALALSTFAPPASAHEQAASAELEGHPLQQVALTTRDLPRAVGFYRDALGLPLLFESNGMAFFDVAGMRLMIAHDPARPQTSRPTSILYFDAPDFEAALERLRATGIALVGPVETVQRTARGELKLQQFEDPDGNALAIMGTVAAR